MAIILRPPYARHQQDLSADSVMTGPILNAYDRGMKASALAGTVPVVAVGFDLWLQAWFPDAGGSGGWAATSGVAATLAP